MKKVYPNSKDEHSLRSFLKVTSEFRRTYMEREITMNEVTFAGDADLVLQCGRLFPSRISDPQLPKGEGDHITNAHFLSDGRPDLIYCEGWAMGRIPIMHAWCCTKQGEVLDNTWPMDDGHATYFGIPFNRKVIKGAMGQHSHKREGLLNGWDIRYPMMKSSDKKFVQPLDNK